MTLAPLRERVFSNLIVDPSGCLLWTGAFNNNGYGHIYDGAGRAGGMVLIHRVMYEWFVGPIPDGLQIDHLCRVRRCASPAHLEAVTASENRRRSVAAQPVRTECRHGHPYDAANTYHPPQPSGLRQCRACRRVAMRKLNDRLLAERAAQRLARRAS